MGFEDGILDGVSFARARWTGGKILPEIVVLHDTASRLAKGNAAAYLQNNDAKVSVHFVIERDGSLKQQVPIDRRANHAGRSSYHGRSGCNGFSIGIELVNPGKMQPHGQGMARTWYGETFDIEENGIQDVETAEHGRGLWMPHTEAQIGAVVGLLRALFDDIHTLEDITTHWYVSPGRKVDTNPLFPLEHIRSLIFGREDPALDQAEERSFAVSTEELVEIEVPGGCLNMRRWPSFNPNVLAEIPDRTVVPVVRQGNFAGQSWLCVQFGGQQGWIVSRYASPIAHSGPVSTGPISKGDPA